MSKISFAGLPVAHVVHALYHGTPPLGMGRLHHRDNLSVADVQADLAGRAGQRKMYFDYFYGHPLKVELDLDTETFDDRLYDRDAGDGKAAQVIHALRERTSIPGPGVAVTEVAS